MPIAHRNLLLITDKKPSKGHALSVFHPDIQRCYCPVSAKIVLFTRRQVLTRNLLLSKSNLLICLYMHFFITHVIKIHTPHYPFLKSKQYVAINCNSRYLRGSKRTHNSDRSLDVPAHVFVPLTLLNSVVTPLITSSTTALATSFIFCSSAIVDTKLETFMQCCTSEGCIYCDAGTY